MASNIYKIKSSDLSYLRNSGTYKKSNGNNLYLYYLTDTVELKIFRSSNPEDYNAIICFTDSDRFIDTENNRYYFIVDTSTLYNYSDGIWTVIIQSNIDQYKAIVADKAQRDLIGYGEDLLDNNGLLGNGNVVIRDENKLVKGVLADSQVGNNNYLYVYSAFGHNIRISPSSAPGENTKGVLELSTDKVDSDLIANMYYNGILSADDIDLDEGDVMYELQTNSSGVDEDSTIIDDIEISYNVLVDLENPVRNFEIFSNDIEGLNNFIIEEEYKYIQCDDDIDDEIVVKIVLDLTTAENYIFSDELKNTYDTKSNILLPDNYSITIEPYEDADDFILLGYPPYPYINAQLENDNTKLTIEIHSSIKR